MSIKIAVIAFIFLNVALSSCSLEEPKKFSVKSLDTVDKRNDFLDSLIKLDQKVRDDFINAEQTFGYNSIEKQEASIRMQEVDQSNFQVIDAYLQEFGYPEIELYDKESRLAPWLILHHVPATNKVDYRHRNMPILLEAWNRGDLDDGRFSFFLNRMYRQHFGESFTFQGSMKVTEEIDTLLVLMNYKTNKP